MQPIAHLVKVSVPSYCESLPIPNTFRGWFKLGFKDWLSLIPPAAATAGLSYIAYRAFYPNLQINPMIQKDVRKVVDVIDIEDITEKIKLCRCWRSLTWPYCDGAHGPHNRATGDNTGPVVIDVKNKSS